MQKLKLFVLYFLGTIFIVSGVAKLLSIELFELFIYSFKIISFNLAAFAARFFIGVELIIGLSFIVRFKTKAVSIFTLVLLFFFTVFLIYMELSDSKEDCHCFGNLLQLSNTWSIVKNVVLSGLTVFILKNDFNEIKRFRKYIFTGIVCIGFGAAFAIHPPDFIYKKSDRGVHYCEPCLQKFIDKQGLNNRKMVVCFFSPQCKYCKLAAKKMSTIAQIADNQSDIIYILWDNPKEKSDFISESNSSQIRQITIGTLQFLSLTKGEMPLIILSDKDSIRQAYRYDDIDEQDIIQFLKK
jgi:uncharacterized membrane protein YphA (DoxX/SURF4 family)